MFRTSPTSYFIILIPAKAHICHHSGTQFTTSHPWVVANFTPLYLTESHPQSHVRHVLWYPALRPTFTPTPLSTPRRPCPRTPAYSFILKLLGTYAKRTLVLRSYTADALCFVLFLKIIFLGEAFSCHLSAGSKERALLDPSDVTSYVCANYVAQVVLNKG